MNTLIAVMSVVGLFALIFPAYAATADRIAVEARVRAEVSKDLALPWRPGEGLAGRSCLDGRSVKDFPGDVVEIWVNLECPYYGAVIRELQRMQKEPGYVSAWTPKTVPVEDTAAPVQGMRMR